MRRLTLGSMSPTSRATRSAIHVSGLTRRATIRRRAAQRHGLAVVALLDARVEVGVAVERDEELRQELLRAGLVEPAGLAGPPRGSGQRYWSSRPRPTWWCPDSQTTACRKRSAWSASWNVPGRLGRHPLQHPGDLVHAQPAGLGRIARHQRQDRVDGLDGRLAELDGVRVAGGRARARGRLRHATATQQALAEDHAPVGADVVDDAALVEGVAGRQGRQVRGRVDGRDLPAGSA